MSEAPLLAPPDQVARDLRYEELVGELNHRVMNTLAVVQSLARHTLGSNGDPVAQQKDFLERLRALCAIHRLLGRNSWEFAHVRCALEIALAPYPADKWSLDGPTVVLDPGAAIDLALVFNELSADSGKSGALGAPRGALQVAWTAQGERVRLTWRESGFEAPRALPKGSFGKRLVDQLVTRQLAGALSVERTPDGLICTLSFATSRTVAAGSAVLG